MLLFEREALKLAKEQIVQLRWSLTKPLHRSFVQFSNFVLFHNQSSSKDSLDWNLFKYIFSVFKNSVAMVNSFSTAEKWWIFALKVPHLKPPNSQIKMVLCYCLIVENDKAIYKGFPLHLTNHRSSHGLLCLTHVFNAFATIVCWDPRIFAKRFVLRTFYSKFNFFVTKKFAL